MQRAEFSLCFTYITGLGITKLESMVEIPDDMMETKSPLLRLKLLRAEATENCGALVENECGDSRYLSIERDYGARRNLDKYFSDIIGVRGWRE